MRPCIQGGSSDGFVRHSPSLCHTCAGGRRGAWVMKGARAWVGVGKHRVSGEGTEGSSLGTTADAHPWCHTGSLHG